MYVLSVTYMYLRLLPISFRYCVFVCLFHKVYYRVCRHVTMVCFAVGDLCLKAWPRFREVRAKICYLFAMETGCLSNPGKKTRCTDILCIRGIWVLGRKFETYTKEYGWSCCCFRWIGRNAPKGEHFSVVDYLMAINALYLYAHL